MPYLIDGYNVLHALGLLRPGAGPTGLERARARLVGLIHGACGDNSGDATIVFDAGRHAPDFPHQQDQLGVHVLFSVHPQQADDLIEDLIRRDSAPRRLAVVSDDHRVQAAARRRHCRVVGCLDFMEELGRIRRRRHPPESPEKRATMGPNDVQAWLDEFADLPDSADMKRLSEPSQFLDIDPSGEKKN